ncbi:MAG: efflux RND transporter permease subunit [Alphaproteobacteria bacterium]
MSKKPVKGWMAWFARNPVAANLLMIILLLVGGSTALNMRTEGFPAEAPRNVTVSVDFEGGSPEDVEEGAAIKVEDALNGVAGIKKMTSTVTGNNASIIVQAEEGYSVNTLKDDVKIRVDAISTFPTQVESTVITAQQEERHVIYVQLYGDTDHGTLKEAARRVRERLLDLKNVNKVTTSGAKVFEINIEIQEEKLRSYGLSFDEVANAISGSSINLSAGALKTTGGTITLQSRRQRYHGSEFQDIVVRNSAQGGLVRVKDIAVVNDGYTEQAILSRFQGKPSINLDVQLIGRASITEASSNVQKAVDLMRSENWFPDTIELSTWYDEADIIRDRLGLLSKNALVGMALVLVMLALFLNAKVAFWVAIGIPVSFAGTLIVMGPSFLDYSLNDLTTFAFIIVLGIVVDDAIVIGENVFTHKKRYGGGVETAIRGAKEVATPATFGVLTTVAAFYPLTTMTGDFGGPFRIIAVVTIVCLLFSLVESKLILPAHLAHLNLDDDKPKNRVAKMWARLQEGVESSLQNFIKVYYKPIIEAVVRYRYQSLGVFIAILILAGGLVSSGTVRTVFFADWESDIIYADLTMNSGVPSDKTHLVAANLERGLKAVNQSVKQKYAMDVYPVVYFYVSSDEDEQATLTVQLIPGTQRTFSGSEFLNLWREETGVQNEVKQLDFYAGWGGEDDLLIEMSSPDNIALRHAMTALRGRVTEYAGVHDIKTNLDNDTLELAIQLKPEAEALGLTYRDVINQLRNAVFGYEAQRVQRDSEEIRVKVRYPKAERDNISDLEQVRIRTADGGSVPLSVIAELSRHKKQTQIDRIDGDRVLTLVARINKDLISPSEVVRDLQNTVFPDIAARYPGVRLNMSGETEAEQKATTKLAAGFVLGLLMIYTLLAVPLKSYTEPFVIMLAIPFGIIGAIIGHMIIGIPVSLLSFFGVLALSGVVVNDSLVLVSRYNQIRAEGLSYEEAIVQAGMSRFRAILLTSITTFVGLFPLILEKSEQAQLLIPMAVSLAFGILFATFITLLIIPVLLGVRLDIINFFRWLILPNKPPIAAE